MKRNLFGREKAVSPVIATILMVAITVVLAATLYMMVTIQDPETQLIAGKLVLRSDLTRFTPRGNEYATAVFSTTMTNPSSVERENVNYIVLDAQGNELTEGHEADYEGEWSLFVKDDRVGTGTRLTLVFHGLEDGETIRGYEVVVRIHGYSGSLNGLIGP